jgi:hypothetical protein
MFQVVAKCSNRHSFVLGEITQAEAEQAQADDPTITCQGVYLIAVDNDQPKQPGKVLARFVSEEAAQQVARFFRSQGLLEA